MPNSGVISHLEMQNLCIENIFCVDNYRRLNPYKSLALTLDSSEVDWLLKGPKHDQVGYEFFYIKQTPMVRWLGDW